MLVLIDGRSVYSPLFSGVYWDMQDIPPEDIERIEVISGPSATLWGANAVNGVVNIITRNAKDTRGLYAELDGGNFENAATLQYGGKIGSGVAFRLYGRSYYERAFQSQSRTSAHDGWSNPDGGLRLDWQNGDDLVSFAGGLSFGHEGRNGSPAQDFNEKYAQAMWQRTLSGDSTLQVLGYYDEVQRSSVNDSGGFVVRNYDLEFQHSFALGTWNRILWGGGDRLSPYRITPQIGATSLLFDPAARTLNLAQAFIQDTITPLDHLNLILGLKLEDDPYSGLAPLPNLRLAWTPADGLLVWAAVSRAIRSPTPFDRDVVEKVGPNVFLTGNPRFAAESVTAFEMGDRAQFARSSISVSGFYNDYTHLRTIEFSQGNALPLLWGNLMDGHSYGLEIWGNYQLTDWWRVDAGLNLLHEHFGFVTGSSGLLGTAQAGNDPHHQASLRSSMQFGKISFESDLRYVGTLPNPRVPEYVELSSRLSWQIFDKTEISLAGFNLLHAHHQEWTIPPSDEIPRMVMLQLRQRY
jgi:iron complex outermembrane receptor protein